MKYVTITLCAIVINVTVSDLQVNAASLIYLIIKSDFFCLDHL